MIALFQQLYEGGGATDDVMRHLTALAAVAGVITISIVIAILASVSTRLDGSDVTRHLDAWSGGTVTRGGKPVIAVLPVPTVTVKDVTVRTNDDAGEPALITVPALTARPKLLPLLIGRVEVAAITFLDPRIHLVRDASGRTNWQAGPGGTASALTAVLSGEGRPPAGEVIVRNGTVTYEDQRTGRRHTVTAADLDLSWEPRARAARIAGSLVWRGATLNVDAGIDDPAAVLSRAGSRGRLTLTVEPMHDAGKSATDVADLLVGLAERLGAAVGTGATLGPLELDGRFTVGQDRVTLSDATISFEGNTATGTAVVDLDGARPALRGRLAFDGLDLSPYARALLPTDISGLLGLPLPADLLTRADADFDLFASEVDLGPLRLAGTRARLGVRHGRLTFDLAETGLADGEVNGRLAMGPAGDRHGMAVKLSGRIHAMSLGEISDAIRAYRPTPLVATGQPPRGTAMGMGELAGRGHTVGAVIGSLSGWVVANVQHGSIDGADLILTLERLEHGNDVIAKGRAPFLPMGGRTHFARLSARMTASEGMVRAQARIAGDRFEVTLSGQSDLRKGEIVAGGSASLLGRGPDADGARSQPLVRLPFGVGGTLREPVIAPGIPLIEPRARQARAAWPAAANDPGHGRPER